MLVFDLDGTLVDSLQDLAGALNHALSNQNLPALDKDKVRSLIGDGIDDLLAKAVADINHADIEEIKNDFTAYYLRHLTDTTRLFPGMEDILKTIAADKAILTNKRSGPTGEICRKLAITQYFKNIVGAGPAIKLKPDPEQLIGLTAGYERDLCCMIGDGINDVLSAKAANIRSIAVGYGYTSRADLLSLKPDYFVEDTASLKALLKKIFG